MQARGIAALRAASHRWRSANPVRAARPAAEPAAQLFGGQTERPPDRGQGFGGGPAHRAARNAEPRRGTAGGARDRRGAGARPRGTAEPHAAAAAAAAAAPPSPDAAAAAAAVGSTAAACGGRGHSGYVDTSGAGGGPARASRRNLGSSGPRLGAGGHGPRVHTRAVHGLSDAARRATGRVGDARTGGGAAGSDVGRGRVEERQQLGLGELRCGAGRQRPRRAPRRLL